jgi:hypothetical protein
VAQPWVVPYHGEYLATAEPVDVFSSTIVAFTSASPTGPWTYDGTIASVPASPPSYGASTRVDLPGTVSPVVVYSTNNNVFTGDPPTISGYGPHFATPTNLP